MSVRFQPEELLAHKWIDRLKLRHPINIEKIVGAFADISYDHIPIDADAVLIKSPKCGKKPIIILDTDLHQNRITFTLAHELGHILIPWHAGTFACSPVESISRHPIEALIHRDMETEANRFASEFLMPTAIIRKVFDASNDINEVIVWAANAKISSIAASIKLSKALPSGFLMVEIAPNQIVLKSNRTAGTFMDAPIVGKRLIMKAFNELGATITKVQTSSSEILWIDTRSCKLSHPKLHPNADSRIIIKEIIDDLGCKDCRPSINGVIGAANGMSQTKEGQTDLFTILKGRFLNRDDLQHVIEHPRFDEFLAAKAHEIRPK